MFRRRVIGNYLKFPTVYASFENEEDYINGFISGRTSFNSRGGVLFLGKERGFSQLTRPVHCEEELVTTVDKIVGIDTRRRIYKEWKRPNGSLDRLMFDFLHKYDRPKIDSLPNDGIMNLIKYEYKTSFLDKLGNDNSTYSFSNLKEFNRLDPSSSAGLPWTWNKSQSNRESFDEAVQYIKSIDWMNLSVEDIYDKYALPALAGVRLQISKKEKPDKVRQIWCFPLFVKLIECKFIYPILDNIDTVVDNQNHDFSMIMQGFEVANGGMMRVHRKALDHKTVLTLDFKTHDGTIAPCFCDLYFSNIKSLINFDNDDDFSESELIKMFEFMALYFTRTPILFANGYKFIKLGGNASGSVNTMLFGTFVSYVSVNYTLFYLYNSLPIFQKIQIDDVLAMFSSLIDFNSNDFNYTLNGKFGLIINPKKTNFVKDYSITLTPFEHLGFKCARGSPYKSDDEWLARLLLPENQDLVKGDAVARAVGLYLASCGLCDVLNDICNQFVGRYLNSGPATLSYTQQMRKWLKYAAGIDKQDTVSVLKTPLELQSTLYRRSHLYE